MAGRVPNTLLRAASLMVPRDQRAGWMDEWLSELWYVPQSRGAGFCAGAFRDALWVRRNNTAPAGSTLDSPLRCLAVLAAVAAVSLLIALCLGVPLKLKPSYSHFTARDLPGGCVVTLALSCLLLPGTLIGRAVTASRSNSWITRFRNGIFLALKLVLVQPSLLCSFMVWVLIAPLAPLAPYLLCGGCILALRWVFADQRSRCPVCLRLLGNAVRIGSPSQTFLGWYGAESVCARGHGLLQISEITASHSATPRWLRLDASWSSLFSEAAEVRHP
jgi:hypothetical protein